MSQLGWVFLGLVLGIPLNYFINLSTPWVGSYLKNRSLSIRERKMKMLVDEYETMKGYKENPSTMIVMLLSLVMWAILMLAVIIMLSLASETLYKFVVIAMVYLLYFITKGVSNIIENVRKFDKFKEKTIAKVKKLGGNPKDLDKEEAEMQGG